MSEDEAGKLCVCLCLQDQVRTREAALKESMSVCSSTIPDALMAAFALTAISKYFFTKLYVPSNSLFIFSQLYRRFAAAFCLRCCTI